MLIPTALAAVTLLPRMLFCRCRLLRGARRSGAPVEAKCRTSRRVRNWQTTSRRRSKRSPVTRWRTLPRGPATTAAEAAAMSRSSTGTVSTFRSRLPDRDAASVADAHAPISTTSRDKVKVKLNFCIAYGTVMKQSSSNTLSSQIEPMGCRLGPRSRAQA